MKLSEGMFMLLIEVSAHICMCSAKHDKPSAVECQYKLNSSLECLAYVPD